MAMKPPTTQIKFGTDGWRAVIAEDYTFENVRVCAQAVAEDARAQGLTDRGWVVAYDTRFGSDRFAAAVAEVLAAQGIHVYLTRDFTPTPAASFAITHLNANGGVVITASHNPGTYNGFKVKSELGGSAAPEVITRIEERIARLLDDAATIRGRPLLEAEAAGDVERIDITDAYLERLRSLVDIDAIRDAGLQVVTDAMFGAGAGLLSQLLGGGRTRVTELNGAPNPAFPGIAQPEPIEPNLRTLSNAVREGRASVGLAFDGDADRLGVVDENGRYLSTLQTFSMLAHQLLEGRGERGPIVCTITMSAMVDRLGDRYVIDVRRTPVGFKFVGPKMLETSALMGGEESGGYAFKGHVPERDGILSGLLFLEAMVTRERSPAGLLEDLYAVTGPHVFRRIDLEFQEAHRDEIEHRVRAASPGSLGGLRVDNIDDRDGVWFRLEGGSWAIVRFSGTEPLIRTYAEAPDLQTVEALLSEVRRLAGL